jgi:hypothetical protein
MELLKLQLKNLLKLNNTILAPFGPVSKLNLDKYNIIGEKIVQLVVSPPLKK